MKEKKFLKKINSRDNKNGDLTYGYVSRLLRDNTKIAKPKNIFKKFFNYQKTQKSAVDIVKDNFIYILENTNAKQKENLLELIINNEELNSIIEENFKFILVDLKKDNYSEQYAPCFFNLYYSLLDNKEEFLDNNIDLILENVDPFWLLEIVPKIKGVSKEIDEKLNNKLENSKQDICKKMLMVDISEESKELAQVNEQDYNDYASTIRIMIEELLQSENKKWIDIKFINKGGFSSIYKIGEKVLKIGDPRVTYNVKNNERLNQPLVRANIKAKDTGKIFGCIEIANSVYTYFSRQEKEDIDVLYNIYKELRDEGIIWTDVKWENVGRLKNYNIPTLNKEEVYVEPNSVGFDKKNSKVLGKGDLVILDIDFLNNDNIDPEKKYYGADTFSDEFNMRYKKEREELPSKTLNRNKVKNLILELRTEDTLSATALMIADITLMTDLEFKEFLENNNTIGEVEKALKKKLDEIRKKYENKKREIELEK